MMKACAEDALLATAQAYHGDEEKDEDGHGAAADGRRHVDVNQVEAAAEESSLLIRGNVVPVIRLSPWWGWGRVAHLRGLGVVGRGVLGLLGGVARPGLRFSETA